MCLNTPVLTPAQFRGMSLAFNLFACIQRGGRGALYPWDTGFEVVGARAWLLEF